MTGCAPPRTTPDPESWSAYCRRTEAAARRVLAASPDDPLDRAEGLRYVGRIARYGFTRFVEESDPAHPVVTKSLPKLGGDNPDYVYSVACLSGEWEYRLKGRLGDSAYLGLGTYHGDVGTAEGLRLSGYLAGRDLALDAEGRFEVTLSCEKRPGNWLPMRPETSQLMIRELLFDRKRQRSAELVIERVSGGTVATALDADWFTRQLARAGDYVEGSIGQFLEWTKDFASRPNRIDPIAERLASAARGDPFTHYYGGYFEIDPDEMLMVELTPPACEYWNLQLCNHWLESLDYERHTTAVNHHTAVANPDGKVRIAIALRDPGVPNWLDAAGHRRGCLILRQVGTTDPDHPRCALQRIFST